MMLRYLLLVYLAALAFQQNVNPNATIISIATRLVPVLNNYCHVAVTETISVQWSYPATNFSRPIDNIVNPYPSSNNLNDFEIYSVTPDVTITSHAVTRDDANSRLLLYFTFANTSNNGKYALT
jgi:hypothetical protein